MKTYGQLKEELLNLQELQAIGGGAASTKPKPIDSSPPSSSTSSSTSQQQSGILSNVSSGIGNVYQKTGKFFGDNPGMMKNLGIGLAGAGVAASLLGYFSGKFRNPMSDREEAQRTADAKQTKDQETAYQRQSLTDRLKNRLSSFRQRTTSTPLGVPQGNRIKTAPTKFA